MYEKLIPVTRSKKGAERKLWKDKANYTEKVYSCCCCFPLSLWLTPERSDVRSVGGSLDFLLEAHSFSLTFCRVSEEKVWKLCICFLLKWKKGNEIRKAACSIINLHDHQRSSNNNRFSACCRLQKKTLNK